MASITIPTANFISYNSTGIASEKCAFINELSLKNDVMFVSIQEHFKKTKTLDKYFCKKFPSFNPYVIPGHRPDNQDSGRPRAGLAQLVRKGLGVRRDRLSTANFRIQAQILNFPSCQVLWLNSYLPNDPHTVEFDDSDLNEVLNEIVKIIDKAQCANIVWNGDLNWDPSRNSGFSQVMKNFVNRLSLIPLWEHYDVDFTHLHTDSKSTSVLDHFIISESLLQHVESCQVLHRGENPSRHSPILLKLRVGEIPSKHTSIKWKPKKPAWNKATEEMILSYKEDLQERLLSMQTPDCLSCSDPHCSVPSHTIDRDSYILDILCSVVESTHTVYG